MQEVLGRRNIESEKNLMTYGIWVVGRDFKGHGVLMVDSVLSQEHQVLSLFLYVQ